VDGHGLDRKDSTAGGRRNVSLDSMPRYAVRLGQSSVQGLSGYIFSELRQPEHEAKCSHTSNAEV
jgi:hypothetical protein